MSYTTVVPHSHHEHWLGWRHHDPEGPHQPAWAGGPAPAQGAQRPPVRQPLLRPQRQLRQELQDLRQGRRQGTQPSGQGARGSLCHAGRSEFR